MPGCDGLCALAAEVAGSGDACEQFCRLDGFDDGARQRLNGASTKHAQFGGADAVSPGMLLWTACSQDKDSIAIKRRVNRADCQRQRVVSHTSDDVGIGFGEQRVGGDYRNGGVCQRRCAWGWRCGWWFASRSGGSIRPGGGGDYRHAFEEK